MLTYKDVLWDCIFLLLLMNILQKNWCGLIIRGKSTMTGQSIGRLETFVDALGVLAISSHTNPRLWRISPQASAFLYWHLGSMRFPSHKSFNIPDTVENPTRDTCFQCIKYSVALFSCPDAYRSVSYSHQENSKWSSTS